MLRALCTLAIVLLLPALAATAAAQPSPPRPAPDEATLSLAREHYETGVRAADAGRWSEAADAFERSYALSRAAAALANLVAARVALGQAVAARDDADRLLRDHPDIDSDRRAWAERTRAEAAARIAHLELLGVDRGARIEVDGRAVPSATLELDPGPHTVLVEADARAPYRWRGSLRPGEHLGLHVRLAEIATPDREPEPESPPITSRPAFWIGLGAGLAAIAAGAVALGVALDEPDDERLTPLASTVLRL